MVPMTPTGTLTKKTSRQSKTAKTPPKTKPISEPARKASWLIPKALPRSFAGNASVMIAPLLEKRNAAPTPWTIRKAISSMAPASPVLGVRNNRIEPTVKMSKAQVVEFNSAVHVR